MSKIQYNDYPILDVLDECDKHVKRGSTVYQKWTCQHCNSRQTMETPNVLYRSGRCEECNQVTIIEKCNYMLITGGFNV